MIRTNSIIVFLIANLGFLLPSTVSASAALEAALDALSAEVAATGSISLQELNRLGMTIDSSGASINANLHKLKGVVSKVIENQTLEEAAIVNASIMAKNSLLYDPARTACIEASASAQGAASEVISRRKIIVDQNENAIRNTKTVSTTRDMMQQIVKSQNQYCQDCEMPYANVNSNSIFSSSDTANGEFVLTEKEEKASDDFIKLITNPVPDQRIDSNAYYSMLKNTRAARVSVAQRALNSIKSKRIKATDRSSKIKALKTRIDSKNNPTWLLGGGVALSPAAVSNEIRQLAALKTQVNFLMFEELEEIKSVLATLLAQEINPVTKSDVANAK